GEWTRVRRAHEACVPCRAPLTPRSSSLEHNRLHAGAREFKRDASADRATADDRHIGGINRRSLHRPNRVLRSGMCLMCAAWVLARRATQTLEDPPMLSLIASKAPPSSSQPT